MFALPVRGCHPLRRVFPNASGCLAFITGLVRVRSPLLAESRLMSSPRGTEMFQFPRVCLKPPILFGSLILHLITGSPKPLGSASQDLLLWFRLCTKLRAKDLRAPVIEGGFPHSEIRGSKVVPHLPTALSQRTTSFIASQRQGHPPYALKALDCSYHRYPRLGRVCPSVRSLARMKKASMQSFRKDQLASQIQLRGCGCRLAALAREQKTIQTSVRGCPKTDAG